MRILGIHDGHTATASLLEDGNIISVISEERLNRTKEWLGFPKLAVKKILGDNNLSGEDIDLVVISGLTQPTTLDNLIGKKKSIYMSGFNIFRILTPRPLIEKNWWVAPAIKLAHAFRKKNEIFSYLKSFGISSKKVIFADHHTIHLHTTLLNFWGQKDNMLILTLDGAGDGYSATVSKIQNGKLSVIEKTNIYSSLGLLYSRITQFLNMKPLSHEYKVMGLAAYSKESCSQEAYDALKTKFMKVDSENPLKLKNISGAVNYEYISKLNKHFKETRFDNLAGGAQRLVENIVHKWAINAVKKTGIKDVFCAGGVFMNVKANMKLAYDKNINKLFIFPSCSDESNAIGACIYGYKKLCEKNKKEFRIQELKHIYFGPEYSEKQILSVLEKYKSKISYKKVKNINKFVAQMLAKGEILARCSGKMEFGARALGNRSILAHPNKTDVVREINEAIKQRDFWMPFAASILKEKENSYLINPKKTNAPFMILSFKTKPLAKKHLINGMHNYDLTCRPQIVEKKANQDYYEILKHFEKLTGIGGILNTSFNIHGDPVVCSPEDAVGTLLKSGLKNLIIGNYYVRKR